MRGGIRAVGQRGGIVWGSLGAAEHSLPPWRGAGCEGQQIGSEKVGMSRKRNSCRRTHLQLLLATGGCLD